jgi:serine kinase of HPr protein (carbohydrate metabolism regulator)
MSCENTVCPVYMSHPSDRFGVAIRQKKIQVDKKKKHAQLSVNICFLTREFSINRTLLKYTLKSSLPPLRGRVRVEVGNNRILECTIPLPLIPSRQGRGYAKE